MAEHMAYQQLKNDNILFVHLFCHFDFVSLVFFQFKKIVLKEKK